MNNRWRLYIKLAREETGKEGLFLPLTKRLVIYKNPDDPSALYCYTMDGFSWVSKGTGKEYPCAYWNKWLVKSPIKLNKTKRKRL